MTEQMKGYKIFIFFFCANEFGTGDIVTSLQVTIHVYIHTCFYLFALLRFLINFMYETQTQSEIVTRE